MTADGYFTVSASSSKDPACSLIGADDKSYKLESYAGSDSMYVASGVPAGSYVLKCDGIASDATIYAYNASPEVIAKVFAMPFLWGTIVGVVGLILLIVGIVLLVKVNGKRRRITQEAMLSAVRCLRFRQGDEARGTIPGLVPFAVPSDAFPHDRKQRTIEGYLSVPIASAYCSVRVPHCYA